MLLRAPRSARRHTPLVGLCAAATLTIGGVAAVTTSATAVPGPSFDACPAPFPADELVPDQQATGLTTIGGSSATEPTTFTGTYLGTVEDDAGDLLVFDLRGARVTHPDGSVNAGVWSGMSGSPLYAEDGRLIGSVSYSFGGWTNASSIAGVTPAADLYDALDDHELVDAPDDEDAPEPALPEMVRVSKTERAELVRQGATASAVGSGARRIEPLTAVSVKGAQWAGYQEIAERAGRPAARQSAGGAGTSSPVIPVDGGGDNIAFADSYGSVTSYGLGTAAAVCDDIAVGYGHSGDFAPASRSMHGASTVFIQPDGPASFKMANLGAPVGTQLVDGLNAVTGRNGVLSRTTEVASQTNGLKPQTSTSWVANPEALAEIAATQAYRDAALALNSAGGGQSIISWTIDFTREDGTPDQLVRKQRYSSRSSIAELVTTDVAADLMALHDNPWEDVRIDDVTIRNDVKTTYRALKIGTVERKVGKTWKKVAANSTQSVKRGTTVELRVKLVKADRWSKAAERTRTLTYAVPKTATGTGRIRLEGNAMEWDDFDEYEELYYYEYEDEYDDDPLLLTDPEPESLDDLLAQLRDAPRQDQLVASLDYRTTKTGLVNDAKRAEAVAILKGSFRAKLKITK